jgi:penicillin amidase
VTARSTTETIVVEGLGAPAEIAVDRWGIPHLRASSRDDLFFVQGFNAARDRLWQIDL